MFLPPKKIWMGLLRWPRISFRRRPWTMFLVLVSLTILLILLYIWTENNVYIYTKVRTTDLFWSFLPGGLSISKVLEVEGLKDDGLQGFPRVFCGCSSRQNHSISHGASDGMGQFNSTCSPEATQLGRNQRVISYSLLVRSREDVVYFLEGLTPNLEKVQELYPGWLVRIYTDIPLNQYSCGFICKHPNLFWCDITNVPGMGNLRPINFRVWRFLPLGDPTVKIMLSRDLDSQITMRERTVVAEWEESDKIFHVIRDSEYHSLKILGGLWGAKNYMLDPQKSKSIQRDLIEGGKESSEGFGWDQTLLIRVIYDHNLDQILAHDSYFCQVYTEVKTRPFPSQRIGDHFVGKADRKVRTFYWRKRMEACPVECRPGHGKEWTFC